MTTLTQERTNFGKKLLIILPSKVTKNEYLLSIPSLDRDVENKERPFPFLTVQLGLEHLTAKSLSPEFWFSFGGIVLKGILWPQYLKGAFIVKDLSHLTELVRSPQPNDTRLLIMHQDKLFHGLIKYVGQNQRFFCPIKSFCICITTARILIANYACIDMLSGLHILSGEYAISFINSPFLPNMCAECSRGP